MNDTEFVFDEKGSTEVVKTLLINKLGLTWDEAQEFSQDIITEVKEKFVPKSAVPTVLEKLMAPVFGFGLHMARQHSGFAFTFVSLTCLWTALLSTYFFLVPLPWYLITGVWVTLVAVGFFTCAFIVSESET